MLLARQALIDLDAEGAEAAWARVFAAGGAVAWTGTLHDVDARNYFLLAFDLTRPVRVASDRNGKSKTIDEIKVALHGAAPSFEVYKPVGEYHVAVRGRGPAGFQDLVRRTLVKLVDPERRIALPPLKPGVGW